MDMSWVLGHSRTTFHHSSETLPLQMASTDKRSDVMTLLDLCKSVTPPCKLNPFLCGGHVQTIYNAVCKADAPIHYRRRVFECTDLHYPGSFAVDFVTRDPAAETVKVSTLHPRTTYFSEDEWGAIEAGSMDTKPMLVALHGLSGGSHELYLREVFAPLVGLKPSDSPISIDGPDAWEICVVNARGCARSQITSPMLFNARATWDLRTVVQWLQEKFPNRKLFGIGFSLGANIMVNYVGEEGPRCAFKAAVACSNPWDLSAGNLALQRTWIGRKVYSKTMADNLRKVFKRHIEQLSKHPNSNVEKILKTRYLHDFDRELQCPTWGYPTEGAYYKDASSTEPLLAVRTPLFCLNAEDDPVAPLESLPLQEVTKNPFSVLCTTSMGGHLSWFETGGGRWFVKPVVGFLVRMASEVDLVALELMRDNVKQSGMKPSGPMFDPLRRKLQLEL